MSVGVVVRQFSSPREAAVALLAAVTVLSRHDPWDEEDDEGAENDGLTPETRFCWRGR